MKNYLRVAFLALAFNTILFGGTDSETLECPFQPSLFTICGLDNGYSETATNDTDKYVQSTEFGSSNPFQVGGNGAGIVLDPLTVGGVGTNLIADWFFGTDLYNEYGRGFICGDLVDSEGNVRTNVNVVLKKLNTSSGKYQCDYQDAHKGITILKCDYTNKACAADINNVKNGFKVVRTKTHIAEYSLFPDYQPDSAEFTGVLISDFYNESDPYNGIRPLNYKDLGEAVDQLDDANFLDVYGIAQYYGLNDTTDDMDGGQKYNWNVAGILAGLITLDKNYFDGVNVDGNIQLKKEILSNNPAKDVVENAITNEKGIYNYLLGESTTVNGSDGINEALKNSTFNSSGNERVAALKSFIDQFDKKLWGFWVTLNSNISKAYEKINQFTFFMAAIWMIGVLGIQKGIRSFNSGHDNTEYGMKMFSAAAGLIFFFVPVSSTTDINLSNTSPAADRTFERGLPSGSAVFDEDSSFGSTYRERMTVYKFFIQHFAQEANAFATATSNAVLVSYADYLTGRQNAFKSRVELGAEMKKSYLHVLEGEKEYEFLRNICVPMYKYGYDQRKTFLMSDKNLRNYMYDQINKETKGWDEISSIEDWITFRKISGIDIVDPTICRSLEKSYKENVKLALDSFGSIATKVTHTDADTAIGTEIIIHNMFIMQSFLGWINSATMPISYFLLKQANMFADGEESPSLSDRVGNAKDMTDGIQTDFSESDRLSTSGQSVGDSVSSGVGATMSFPLSATVYFMAPGFDNIFNYIYKLSENAFLTDENNQNKGVLTKLFKKIWTKSTFNPTTFAANLLTSKFTLMIVSIGISIWLYMFMLNVIFMSLIALMILLRIILYFVDLLKYFFVSPFVVIWSVTVNRSYERVTAFIAQGAVLTLYPTLIVLSATIFIFAYELMQMLSGMMIGSLVSQLETQYSIVNSTSAGGGGTFAFMDYLKIFTLEQSLELTMTLLSLFLAYKIIYEGPTWFLAMFGYKEGDTHGGQMIREVSEKVNRTSNPVI